MTKKSKSILENIEREYASSIVWDLKNSVTGSRNLSYATYANDRQAVIASARWELISNDDMEEILKELDQMEDKIDNSPLFDIVCTGIRSREKDTNEWIGDWGEYANTLYELMK